MWENFGLVEIAKAVTGLTRSLPFSPTFEGRREEEGEEGGRRGGRKEGRKAGRKELGHFYFWLCFIQGYLGAGCLCVCTFTSLFSLHQFKGCFIWFYLNYLKLNSKVAEKPEEFQTEQCVFPSKKWCCFNRTYSDIGGHPYFYTGNEEVYGAVGFPSTGPLLQ